VLDCRMLKIVFENESFVIVDKPGGTLSVPSQWGQEDPRPVLSILLQDQLNQRLWPVHRLDFEVSGLVILAKSERPHRMANEWFESREIHKVYEAWGVGSAPATGFFEWHSMLHRGKKRSFESPHGKLAVTRAFWLKTLPAKNVPLQQWALDPLTGRPHQLRVEMAKHQNPILGDELYGETHTFLPEVIALRAVKLDFKNCSSAIKLGLPEFLEIPKIESLLTSELKSQLGWESPN